jgi:hypothetical protein
MATEAQVLANRQNAAHSTGPRTPEGKARSSQNRLTHGLAGRHIVMSGEDPAEFDALLEALWIEHQPETATEEILVEEMAHARWKMLRIYCRGLHKSLDSEGLARFDRYEASARRTFYKAIEELRRLRAGRARESAAQGKAPAYPPERQPVAPQPHNRTNPIPANSPAPIPAAGASICPLKMPGPAL